MTARFDRDILMQMDPRAFFFTEHYRDYPAVLIRLAEVPRPLLTTVVTDSWRHVSALPPRQSRPKTSRRLHRMLQGDSHRRMDP